MSIGKYGIYMNVMRSRDVGDAIPYKALVYARAPSLKNLTNAAGKLSGILIKKIKDGFEWI